MIARDQTLSSLYGARDKLTDLITVWAPSPTADGATQAAQADQLKKLIQERDQVTGAINMVFATEFAGVANKDLIAASEELAGVTKQLVSFQKTMADINSVLRIVDQVVQSATKVIKLAASV